jgi:hypothetical protein
MILTFGKRTEVVNKRLTNEIVFDLRDRRAGNSEKERGTLMQARKAVMGDRTAVKWS